MLDCQDHKLIAFETDRISGRYCKSCGYYEVGVKSSTQQNFKPETKQENDLFIKFREGRFSAYSIFGHMRAENDK